MTLNAEISMGNVLDGFLVPFGNVDPKNDRRLRIPDKFQRVVRYADMQLEVELDCVFSGDRIEISKMVISGSGKYIGSRELTQLALPQVIRKIALDVIPNSEEWTIEHRDQDRDWNGLNSGDGFLAQLYWFEHVTWGAPRAALMEFLGCSRTTANSHIKRFGKLYPLPGIHSTVKKLLPKSD